MSASLERLQTLIVLQSKIPRTANHSPVEGKELPGWGGLFPHPWGRTGFMVNDSAHKQDLGCQKAKYRPVLDEISCQTDHNRHWSRTV